MIRFDRLLTIGMLILLTACSPGTGSTTSSAPSGIGTVSVATAVAVIVTPLPPDFTPPPTAIPPTDTPIPTLPGGLGPTELKYRILDQFPDLFFCDRDFYPIARADEKDLAQQRFPEIQANSEEFDTILAHNQLTGQSTFTDDQKLLIYRAHKKLAAIPFTLNSTGYQFQIQAAKTEGQGEIITGQIDSQGKITVQQRKPSIATCPICLAAGTLIDTPAGQTPVEKLQAGMMVWTLSSAGKRVAAPVIMVGKTIVPANHQILHLVLNDGRELWVSPGHPTMDGRRIGQLRVHDRLDGGSIQSVERVPYTGLATFDLLPSGATGFYWANGILVASTLNFNR
jgi:hypothetical protein